MLSSLPVRRLVLAIAAVAMSTLPVFLAGAGFIQLSDDIGLTTTTLGAATASFFLAAAAASTPLGRVVERIGWQRALRWNALVAGVTLIGIAATVRTPLTLSVFLAVGGVGYGFTNPAANQALAEQVEPRRRALVFGLKHGGIPASTLLAGLAVPALIVTIGWRPTYAIAALLIPVVLLLIPRQPSDPARATAPPPRSRERTMSDRLLTVLAFAATCATGAAISLSTFLVAAAVDGGFTESEAGVLLFAGSAASITARVGAGGFTDARRGRGFAGVAALMGAGAVVFFLLPAASGAWFTILVMAAFATGWGWPGLMTFTVVNANPGTPAASSAITQSGVFLGAGLAPVAIGWVIDRWSYAVSWTLVGCLLLVAASIVTFVGVRAGRLDLAPG